MIQGIELLKPESEEVEKYFLKFATDLSKATGGKGCFSVTVYQGEDEDRYEEIREYLMKYDKRKKKIKLGPYLWEAELSTKIDCKGMRTIPGCGNKIDPWYHSILTCDFIYTIQLYLYETEQ